MKLPLIRILAFLLLASVARGQTPPAADHHQHIFSPAMVKLLTTGSSGPQSLTAYDVIAGPSDLYYHFTFPTTTSRPWLLNDGPSDLTTSFRSLLTAH